MDLRRVTNGLGVDYMTSHLRVAERDGETVEDLVDVLKSCLSSSPDSLFILQAFEEEELKAFLLAHAPSTSKVVTIIQVWMADEGKEVRQVVERMFFRLQFWTDNLGREELRGESLRGLKPFLKRWGFTPYTTTYRYIIPENFELTKVNGQEGLKKVNGEKNGKTNTTSV